MAATRWKVYRGKEHIASCKHLEDAVRIVIEGDKILDGDWPGRPMVWHEGYETISGPESFDEATQMILDRVKERFEAYKKTCVPTRLGDAFGR
jgi:hypothetical protein